MPKLARRRSLRSWLFTRRLKTKLGNRGGLLTRDPVWMWSSEPTHTHARRGTDLGPRLDTTSGLWCGRTDHGRRGLRVHLSPFLSSFNSYGVRVSCLGPTPRVYSVVCSTHLLESRVRFPWVSQEGRLGCTRSRSSFDGTQPRPVSCYLSFPGSTGTECGRRRAEGDQKDSETSRSWEEVNGHGSFGPRGVSGSEPTTSTRTTDVQSRIYREGGPSEGTGG